MNNLEYFFSQFQNDPTRSESIFNNTSVIIFPGVSFSEIKCFNLKFPISTFISNTFDDVPWILQMHFIMLLAGFNFSLTQIIIVEMV